MSSPTTNIPTLGEGFQEQPVTGVSKSASSSDREQDVPSKTEKSTKRRLFGLIKKKDDGKGKDKKKEPTTSTVAPKTPFSPASPEKKNYPYQHQSSSTPGRKFSSTPRLSSPAGSQIFERDVQESTLQVPNSPAIPSHIQTENHIPPVLDASSEAITNKGLDPDTVEIVTHSSHQPASAAVTGIAYNEAGGSPWQDELMTHPDKDDAASNYGALDSTDVHRLSFISFADVVQSEHAEHVGGRDSTTNMPNLTSMSSAGTNRSPSPIRSPVSSQGFGTSPPTSGSPSVKGIDLSPSRIGRPLGSPTSIPSPATGGELTIETMSQALRKTGSGDLGGIRSQPLSPVSTDGTSERAVR
jgi:hypothetical protein